ncbi:peptidylprolyl isomerase [Blastomonas marina]|uniref:peptidylprolyl isomerase n=1 Tax=Blastomonas marina TaxID=1867408 RepID=UPI002AC8DD3C|nr:peptidylprolyl isomerase [Blastomonas marina]WPZ03928.1 peptidylprolyl isomerase [Blastomonas marina]
MKAFGRFMTIALAASLAGGCATTPSTPPEREPDQRSYAEFLADIPETDWQEIAPEDLMVLEWNDRESGEPQRMVIRLMELDYGAAWAANVRAMARRNYWRDGAIYRVIPGFVAQWGLVPDPDAEEEPADPDYLQTIPPGSYIAPLSGAASPDQCRRSATALSGVCDSYAPQVRFVDGWVFGSDGELMWPLFCRGTVGVARGMAPAQGSGVALYAVLANDHRRMDRNLGMVGRVVEGFDLLDELPGGTGDGGVYADSADVHAFTRVALAADLPETERPRYRYLKTESASYTALLDWVVQPNAFYTERYAAADACRDIVPVTPIED